MWQRILCVCLVASCAIAVDNEVEKLFRDMEVVSDILDEPPKEMLKVGSIK